MLVCTRIHTPWADERTMQTSQKSPSKEVLADSDQVTSSLRWDTLNTMSSLISPRSRFSSSPFRCPAFLLKCGHQNWTQTPGMVPVMLYSAGTPPPFSYFSCTDPQLHTVLIQLSVSRRPSNLHSSDLDLGVPYDSDPHLGRIQWLLGLLP